MGSRFAANILKLNYKLAVNDLSKSALNRTALLGAISCKSNAEVAARSDVILTILPTPNSVRAAVLGKDGVLDGMRGRRGKVLVEMSSIDSKTVRDVSTKLASQNCKMLSVTIHGIDEDVEKREVVFGVAGEKKIVESVTPILRKLSRAVVYVGNEPGMAKDMKTATAMLSSLSILGTAEVLAWSIKKGLKPKDLLEVLESSTRVNLVQGLRRAIEGNFKKRTSWVSKDIGFGLKEAEEMNISLPLIAAAQQVFLVRKSHGFDGYDTRGMAARTYKILTNVDLPV